MLQAIVYSRAPPVGPAASDPVIVVPVKKTLAVLPPPEPVTATVPDAGLHGSGEKLLT